MAIFTGCSAKTNNETGSLDGKKIIFIGNSFTHYGNVDVSKGQTIQSQADVKFIFLVHEQAHTTELSY